MAIIRIKRSVDGIAAPSSLGLGEVAITIDESNQSSSSNLAGRLFVGDSSGTPVPIGGEYIYKLLDHTPGVLEDNSALIVGAGGTISGLDIVGVATIATLNAAISEFASLSIGSSVTVGAGTDGQNNFFALSSGAVNARNLTLNGLTTAVSSLDNSVLYVDGNGLVKSSASFTWNDSGFPNLLFVDGTISAGSTVTGAVGLFTDATISNAFTIGNYVFPTGIGNSGQVLEAQTDGSLKFATIDQRLNIIGQSGTASVGLSSEFFRIIGTDNEIETVAVGNTVIIGLPDDVLVGGGLTVAGDMTVNGNLTYLSSTITQIEDKNIELAVPDTGSPSDATADGGGITVKGDSDYTITWSNSRDEWVFNQSIGPSSSTLNLGSDSTRWGYLYVTRGEIVDLNATGVVTFSSLSLGSGSFENVTIGIGTSAAARFTDVGFTTASGGDTTLRTLVVTGVSTVASLFLSDSLDTNGVAYAGTDGKVGFTSAPTAGISTSTYILTSLGGVPVYTDTIDCGTY